MPSFCQAGLVLEDAVVLEEAEALEAAAGS
jgi:hypothetical protein